MGLNRYRVLRYSWPIVGRTPLVAYPIAAISGAVAWRVRERERKNLIRNMLVLCDGDRKRALQQARLVFRNISRYWVDVTTIPYRDMTTFEQDHITVVRPELLSVLANPGPVL